MLVALPAESNVDRDGSIPHSSSYTHTSQPQLPMWHVLHYFVMPDVEHWQKDRFCRKDSIHPCIMTSLVQVTIVHTLLDALLDISCL